jgi:hypothetical protein
MADPRYTAKTLGAAVQALAVGRGRIKERLNDALSHLVMVDDSVFEVEGIYRDAPDYWRRIWSALTTAKIGAPGEVGIGPASIARMSEDEASSVAQSIVSLDAMLDDYLHGQS